MQCGTITANTPQIKAWWATSMPCNPINTMPQNLKCLHFWFDYTLSQFNPVANTL